MFIKKDLLYIKQNLQEVKAKTLGGGHREIEVPWVSYKKVDRERRRGVGRRRI